MKFEYVDESLNDFAATSFIFRSKSDIEVNGVNYKDAYCFIKQKGSVNTVTSVVFFDKDFLLLKEEFLKGDRPYYKIERIDTVLNFRIK